MKREIYVCDRCGAFGESKEDVEKLGLGKICLGFEINYPYSSYSSPSVYSRHKEWEKQWCRKCRTELGILEEEIKKPDAPNPPSLEDMVREIVRSEMERGGN